MALAKKLEQIFPSYHIALAVSKSPFEDNEGTSSHVDGESVRNKPKPKQIS